MTRIVECHFPIFNVKALIVVANTLSDRIPNIASFKNTHHIIISYISSNSTSISNEPWKAELSSSTFSIENNIIQFITTMGKCHFSIMVTIRNVTRRHKFIFLARLPKLADYFFAAIADADAKEVLPTQQVEHGDGLPARSSPNRRAAHGYPSASCGPISRPTSGSQRSEKPKLLASPGGMWLSPGFCVNSAGALSGVA